MTVGQIKRHIPILLKSKIEVIPDNEVMLALFFVGVSEGMIAGSEEFDDALSSQDPFLEQLEQDRLLNFLRDFHGYLQKMRNQKEDVESRRSSESRRDAP